jgi:DNA-binding NarL/FixJ family response regulator
VSHQTVLPPLILHENAADSPDHVMRLKAHALRAVTALVPAAQAFFVAVTRRLEIENAVALQADDSELSLAREWERYVSEIADVDPFAPHRVGASNATVLALSDVGAAATPFARHLESIGMSDIITMYVRSAGTIVAGIALTRASGSPPFSATDAVSLRRIQPLLEHAYLCAVEPTAEPSYDVLRGDGLTDREVDVVELVVRGATNAEIARSLSLSEATVKSHLARIYTKLGIRSRTRLAILVGGHQTFG